MSSWSCKPVKYTRTESSFCIRMARSHHRPYSIHVQYFVLFTHRDRLLILQPTQRSARCIFREPLVPEGSSPVGFHCAQERRLAASLHLPAGISSHRKAAWIGPSPRAASYYWPDFSPLLSLWKGIRDGLTAPVERAHSDRARSGSRGPHGFLNLFFSLLGGGLLESPTARVQHGPSDSSWLS